VSDGARRILANAAYRLLADVGSKVASVVFFVVMARQLGDEQFGVFAFGLAFVTLASTLANFGQDQILTREVARDHGLLDRYFANTMAIKLVIAGVSLAVTIGIAAAAGLDSVTRDVTILLGLAVVLELLMSTCFASYQAFERLEYIPVALISQRFLTAGVGIAALLGGVGVVAVAGIYLVGAVVGFVLAVWLLLGRVARPQLAVDAERWWPLMRAALPIGLAGVFAVVLFRIDTVMLAAYESKGVVGDYSAGYRLFEATLFVSWSVGAAVYPVFSRLTPSSEPPVGFVYERSVKLVTALTLPLAAGAAVLAGPVIDTLYGEQYDDAVSALRLLAPAIALYPLCYLGGYLLVSQNRQRALTIVYGLVALENILLNLVLIPALSLDGAALGTSISQLLVAVAFVAASQRAVGRIAWRRVLAGPVAATVLATGAMVLLREHFWAALSAATIVYVVALVAIELALYSDDARAVLELVPLRRGATAA
jgi:O-antigen/teichoic acid export membrane protein